MLIEFNHFTIWGFNPIFYPFRGKTPISPSFIPDSLLTKCGLSCEWLIPGECLRRPCLTLWTDAYCFCFCNDHCFLSCCVPLAASAAWLTKSHPRLQLASHQHADAGWGGTKRSNIHKTQRKIRGGKMYRIVYFLYFPVKFYKMS